MLQLQQQNLLLSNYFNKKCLNSEAFFIAFLKKSILFTYLFCILNNMIIKLVGSGEELTSLETLVDKALVELALDDAVKVESTNDSAYKLEL